MTDKDKEDGEKFVDATFEHSARASKFLEGLNLDPIIPELNKYYSVPEGKKDFPGRAMFKGMIFDRKGNAQIPDHETLRHFEKIRLGREALDAIMELFCIKVVGDGNKLGLKIGERTGTDSTPVELPNDSDGTYNGYYKKKMVKKHTTSDYDHNIPLAKQVCPGTEDDNQYLKCMLKKTAVSTEENMDETWFDSGYNCNKNIALAHVDFGLTCHYHIDQDWRKNVTYEHNFGGKTFIYTPEQEINYLYRKYWNEPDYEKDASLEYMMKYLIKKGVHDPVAMYFRNPCVAAYEEYPDGVFDVYHQRNPQ